MQVGRISFEPFAYRTIGFDRILDNLESIMNVTQPMNSDKYPPHNIVSLADNRYVVEIAVAGFKQEDIDITLEKGVLIVSANAKLEGEPNVKYLYKGIGTRAFTKSLRLADTVIVRGAEFNDGILRIGLENVIPEEQKPRKIEIGKSISFDKPTLLNE